MKLCAECRGKLPLLMLYVVFLAGFLAFITAVVSHWHPLPTIAVFLLGCGLGALHVTCCSCRLCRLFKHQRHAH